MAKSLPEPEPLKQWAVTVELHAVIMLLYLRNLTHRFLFYTFLLISNRKHEVQHLYANVSIQLLPVLILFD